MALVVEDGSGLTTAESYISAGDTTTYATARELPSEWTAADDAGKEKALRLATQFIDSQNVGRWIGRRFTQDQALDWPRSSATDMDGYTFLTNVVPQQVKDATAEMALRQVQLASGILLEPDQTSPGTISSERVRVDTIEEEIRYVGGKSQQTVYALVDSLLSELVLSGSETFRG